MSNTTYMSGIWTLIVISLLPQIAAAYLAFRWQKYPRRRWMRYSFIASWVILTTFVVFRVVTVFVYYDVPTLMLIAAASSAAMHFVNTAVLWACTHIFEKRLRANPTDPGRLSASDILAEVIDELVAEGRKKGWL